MWCKLILWYVSDDDVYHRVSRLSTYLLMWKKEIGRQEKMRSETTTVDYWNTEPTYGNETPEHSPMLFYFRHIRCRIRHEMFPYMGMGQLFVPILKNIIKIFYRKYTSTTICFFVRFIVFLAIHLKGNTTIIFQGKLLQAISAFLQPPFFKLFLMFPLLSLIVKISFARLFPNESHTSSILRVLLFLNSVLLVESIMLICGFSNGNMY